MACIACHKSDQIHSWQMDNREWQIFIDTVTILPPRLYPWYLISHQRMILALFLALRQRQSQNLHGSRRHKSRLCEHKKERQNTKEQDSKPARRVRVLYCPPSSRTKKISTRKAQKFQLFHPIGTQCVIGVQLVRAKARRKLMHLSLRLAFLHKDRAWQEQCRRSEFSGAAW